MFYSMKGLGWIILCLVFTLFLNYQVVIAGEISNESISESVKDQNQNINDSNQLDKNSSSRSIEEIFGDEQTFPFVAGLGKNAAH